MRALEQLDDLFSARFALGLGFSHLMERGHPCPHSALGALDLTEPSLTVGLLSRLAQPARQHQRQQFPIAHERPQRMLESCRSILLNKEMRRPGKGVPRPERQRKQPRLSDRNESKRKTEGGEGAETRQHPGGRLAVLAKIVRPEVGK